MVCLSSSLPGGGQCVSMETQSVAMESHTALSSASHPDRTYPVIVSSYSVGPAGVLETTVATKTISNWWYWSVPDADQQAQAGADDPGIGSLGRGTQEAQPPVLHLSSQVTQITELYRHRVTLNEAASSMLKCNTCNLTFREPLDLEKHRQLHLDRRVYKCCICQYTFSDLYNFRCHLRIHDKIATYTCDMCPFMVFGERKQYISHLEDHELAKDSYIPGHTLRLPCFVCKKDFPDRFMQLKPVILQSTLKKLLKRMAWQARLQC
ncbi:hypothetical protein DPMN_184459 [Dreissena polymorpha]|uniref:C2H2-type domain-containing protein n=1 Tax=Dreissena polymorpha TaxID=45954 RepID=A0A9D4DJ99_DREPO|nr:hypothetical protein DPMN_184459 [Dreissena polymorpha]